MDREDDKTILDADRLLRRISPQQIIRECGKVRPSSAAFKDKELSVNIESLMVEQCRELEESLAGHSGFSLASIRAGDVRKHNLPIVKDTDPPNDPAHGLVLGKKRGSFSKAMTLSCEWIVAPTKD